jgi:hypothetical protein
VGVVYGGRESRVAQEAVPVLGRSCDLRADHFERDDASERSLPRLIDDAHGAGSGYRQDFVVAERLAFAKLACH